MRAWSAGCSYGAEAYTLAAVCSQAIPGVPVRILGTDIDQRMVARAKAGEFSAEDARSAPAAAMERWFQKTATGWRAKPALRSLTHFEVGDLLKLQPPASSYELIMCRNTVIYFADQIRDELHARLAHALRPGGVLVIGGTERISDAGVARAGDDPPLHLPKVVMDTSEYMPMFVAETREHLEQLNLAIVRLEENPKDRPTVEEIFRIAHSLKGMSATMGFSRDRRADPRDGGRVRAAAPAHQRPPGGGDRHRVRVPGRPVGGGRGDRDRRSGDARPGPAGRAAALARAAPYSRAGDGSCRDRGPARPRRRARGPGGGRACAPRARHAGRRRC